MSYDETLRVQNQRDLPLGIRLTFAPGWGWFCQHEGQADRVGEFHHDPAVCVAAYRQANLAVDPSDVDDAAWIEVDGQRYLRLRALDGLPLDGACPFCGEPRPAEPPEDSYVGMSQPDEDGSWCEVWRCGCGRLYARQNSPVDATPAQAET